jgi:hypothetical protein
MGSGSCGWRRWWTSGGKRDNISKRDDLLRDRGFSYDSAGIYTDAGPYIPAQKRASACETSWTTIDLTYPLGVREGRGPTLHSPAASLPPSQA